MSETPVAKKFRKLRFAVRFSRRYHLHVQQSYMRWGTLTTFIAAVSASGAFASLDRHEPAATVTAVFAVAAAIASAVNLIIRPTLRALVHKELAERFTVLEKDMELEEEMTDRKLRQFSARRLEIETKEPPTVASLVVLAQNEEAEAGGYGSKDQYPVSRGQRLLACISGLRLDFLTEKA